MKPDRVDIVNIRGDIKLWEVVIEGSNIIKKAKGNYKFRKIDSSTYN